MITSASLQDMAGVLELFLIPFGGGIPAGVIFAKNHAVDWTTTAALYFVSDVILAVIFEMIILAFIKYSKQSPFLTQWLAQYKAMLGKVGFKFGLTPSPFSLIVISFGVDPMTGRVASRAAGYGFVSGWTVAIIGDMFYFALIMSSTLWLNHILGDGTWATIIVTVAMILIPLSIDFIKQQKVRGVSPISSRDPHE